MVTRRGILEKAADECMKELYSHAQPKVEWEDFVQQCVEYSKKYDEWSHKKDRGNKLEEIGPAPYEFYYINNKYMKDIVDSYVHAYKIDNHQQLCDILQILKDYFKEPIVDKYIKGHTDENGFTHPGYRSYDHPQSLLENIKQVVGDDEKAQKAYDEVIKHMNMAENFFSWNAELNSFSMTIYLGASPNSNKEAVVDNWKKYRGVDIEIDDSMYKDDEDEYCDEKEEVEED